MLRRERLPSQIRRAVTLSRATPARDVWAGAGAAAVGAAEGDERAPALASPAPHCPEPRRSRRAFPPSVSRAHVLQWLDLRAECVWQGGSAALSEAAVAQLDTLDEGRTTAWNPSAHA